MPNDNISSISEMMLNMTFMDSDSSSSSSSSGSSTTTSSSSSSSSSSSTSAPVFPWTTLVTNVTMHLVTPAATSSVTRFGSRFNRSHGRHAVVPDWSTARVELKWTWLLHTYGFACLFFMLAFYAFFSILNLRAQLSTRPYMSSINVFLCLLGASRAICFLVDPYDSKGIMPPTLGSILWDLAFPCLVSAFGLIQLAFLQLTQLKLGPSKLRSKSCMSLVVSTHFCLTIATNILWVFQHDFKVLRYVCRTAFIFWGSFLSVAFLYGGYHMMQLLKHAPTSMFQRSDSSGFENKVMALGMLANCPNLAAVTAAAAAAVPSFLATPKIRITDENEQTYSYVSDNSHVSSNQNLNGGDGNVSEVLEEKRNSPLKSAIYTVCEDTSNSNSIISETADPERQQMLRRDTSVSISSNRRNRHQQQQQQQHSKTGRTKSSSGRNHQKIKSSGLLGGGDGGRCGSNGTLKVNGVRRHTCPKANDESVEMSLLSNCTVKEDVTLMSILNHIAYVNRAAEDYRFDNHRLKPSSRKSQIEKVLHGTYASALLGFLLCILEAFHVYGPYGISASARPPSPWPWFIFQTICRLVEFSMGCCMANITKQPVNRHHYPYSYYAKHRTGGLYF